jgi:hypothetical protein
MISAQQHVAQWKTVIDSYSLVIYQTTLIVFFLILERNFVYVACNLRTYFYISYISDPHVRADEQLFQDHSLLGCNTMLFGR